MRRAKGLVSIETGCGKKRAVTDVQEKGSMKEQKCAQYKKEKKDL